MKTNSLIQTTQLSKKIILEELMKIKIDHSINISEEFLDQKVNLIFEDCKSLTAENFRFKANSLRKTELFGKFPKSIDFLKSDDMPDKFLTEINNLLGSNLVKEIKDNGEKVTIRLVSCAAMDGWSKLSQNITENAKKTVSDRFKKQTEIKF